MPIVKKPTPVERKAKVSLDLAPSMIQEIKELSKANNWLMADTYRYLIELGLKYHDGSNFVIVEGIE